MHVVSLATRQYVVARGTLTVMDWVLGVTLTGVCGQHEAVVALAHNSALRVALELPEGPRIRARAACEPAAVMYSCRVYDEPAGYRFVYGTVDPHEWEMRQRHDALARLEELLHLMTTRSHVCLHGEHIAKRRPIG